MCDTVNANMTMKLTAYHGSGTGNIREFRTDHSETDKLNCHPLAPVGAWFSGHPAVAALFARFREADGGDPHMYKVEISLRKPRIYTDLLGFNLDFALNPLVDEEIFETYEAWDSARRNYPADCSGANSIREIRTYLEEFGYDGLLLKQSTTDLPLARRDVVVLQPSSIRILDIVPLARRPDFEGLAAEDVQRLFINELQAQNDPAYINVTLDGPRSLPKR